MKLTLRQQITQFAQVLQNELFPVLQEELGELTAPAKRLLATLEMIPLERFVPSSRGWIGRPSKDRLAIARAFVAKAVYGFSFTSQLLDALQRDAQLRQICGWERARSVPHESTFSRAFDEFARMELPQFVHETLIRETLQDRLIGNIARDSTAIEARERFPEAAAHATPRKASSSAPPESPLLAELPAPAPPTDTAALAAPPQPPVAAEPAQKRGRHTKRSPHRRKAPPSVPPAPAVPAEEATPTVPAEPSTPMVLPEASVPVAAPAKKRGRPKGKRGPHKRWKGGKPKPAPRDDTRLHQQRTMTLPEMLADLPKACNIGVKTSASGFTQSWRGYKLHLDVADGQIPISAILTSASLHDSQVAIPLATMSTQRVTYLYELEDSAYDAWEITDHSRSMNHVPIVDPNNRGRSQSEIAPGAPKRELSWAEAEHYKERTMIERVNGRLKDEFGGRTVRVRGASKVMAHLMFGVLALTVDQLLRLVK